MHPFTKIESVRLLPLHARIERQNITGQRFRLRLQPREQSVTKALRATRLIAHQIINIQTPPLVGILDEAPDRDSTHNVTISQEHHPPTIGKHFVQTRHVIRRQHWPQLPMNRLSPCQPGWLNDPAHYVGNGNKLYFRCHAACDSLQESVRHGRSRRADRPRAAGKPDGSDQASAS